MEIVQKKKSNKHTFTFNDDYVNVAYKDKTGSGDADINYVNVPQKSSIQIEQNEWLRNVGLIWVALGIFQLGYAMYSGAPLSGKGLWLFLGVICLIWFYFSKVKYTVLQTAQGNIFVIHEKNHNRIVAELNARRKSQLAEWHGELDTENDLDNEIQKFKWLAAQGAISEEDADRKIAQAELLQRESADIPREKLN